MLYGKHNVYDQKLFYSPRSIINKTVSDIIVINHRR